jgi:hypothetical protein
MSQDLRQYKNKYFTKIQCSMCQGSVDKNNTFIPSECLMKYGIKAAHRICKDCWWDQVKGFALELSSHKCPGCIKSLPLTEYKKEPPIFVDLIEE